MTLLIFHLTTIQPLKSVCRKRFSQQIRSCTKKYQLKINEKLNYIRLDKVGINY